MTEAASSQRVLVFGGTFDHPHRAHVVLPPLVAASLGCGRIIYVPAAINPLKTERPPTSGAHRLAMLELAIAAVPNAEISTIELDRPGPSYMVDTLEQLVAEPGDDVELHLLIGADQSLDFDRWKDVPRILELATPVVMLRPPWSRDAWRNALRAVHDEDDVERWLSRVVELPLIDVCATDLRRRLAAGEAVDELLDPEVLAYIRRHGLYGAPTTG